MSPDGRWIIFHTLLFPNSNSTPSIQSPTLPIRAHISKNSADAQNIQMLSSSGMQAQWWFCK
jgi:hypothetical protein